MDPQSNPLLLASANGSVDQVRRLLPTCDINVAGENGITAVHIASFMGHTAVLQLLIQNRANVNPLTPGDSPLWTALRKGGSESAHHDACAAMLIAAGAHLTRGDTTALHRAACVDSPLAIRAVVEQGFSPDTLDSYGVSALETACQQHSLNALEALIQCGADVGAQSDEGGTALHIAAASRSVQCIAALLAAHADPNVQDCDGLTALHVAAQQGGSVEVVTALLESRCCNPNLQCARGETAVHVAVLEGNFTLAKLLMDHGADPHLVDANHRSALDYAAPGASQAPQATSVPPQSRAQPRAAPQWPQQRTAPPHSPPRQAATREHRIPEAEAHGLARARGPLSGSADLPRWAQQAAELHDQAASITSPPEQPWPRWAQQAAELHDQAASITSPPEQPWGAPREQHPHPQQHRSWEEPNPYRVSADAYPTSAADSRGSQLPRRVEVMPMHRSKNNTPRGPRQPRTPPPSSPPAFGASKHRGDRTAELLAPQDLATKEVMSSLRSAKQEAFATRSAVDALQLEREQKKQAEAEHMDALAQARAAAFQERKALEKKYKGSDGSTLGFPEATPKAQESALSPKERMAERKRLQQEQHEAQLAQAREEAHQERMQLEAKYGKSPSPNKPAAREPRRPAAIPELDMQQAPREAPPAREARVERVREEPSYAEPRQQEGAATQRPLPQARPAATPPPPPPPPALPRLPEGWASNLDPRTGMVYYSNQDGQVQWHHPGMVGAQQHVMGGVVSAPVESDQPLAYADDIAKLHADQQLEREQQRQAEERRMQHEAEQRRLELETEQRRMQHEAEHQRMQHETERRRIEHESEQRRIDHETEQRRMKYEQQRLQEEESMRQREEAEQQRQEAAQRQAADENRQLAESRLHKSRWQSSIVFGDDSSASSPQAQRATVQAGVPLTPGGSATGYRPGSAMERRMRQNRLG